MNEHTPGPWKIGRLGCVVAEQSAGHNDSDLDLQYFLGHLVCESICRTADARLIAAAPDLLESCQQLLEIIEDNQDYSPARLHRARTAIAKATGA